MRLWNPITFYLFKLFKITDKNSKFIEKYKLIDEFNKMKSVTFIIYISKIIITL